MFSAGCGYAWTAIASKLLTDELAAGAVLVGVAWLATAAASEGLALLSEMSALQRRPATRVAPVMFAVQVLVPVVLAPLIFEEPGATTPLGGAVLAASIAVAVAGIVLLAGSRAVGAVLETAHGPRAEPTGCGVGVSLLALRRLPVRHRGTTSRPPGPRTPVRRDQVRDRVRPP